MKSHSKTLVKVFALMLSFVLVSTNSIAGTMAFLTVNTGKVKNTFIPVDTSVSNLIISKKVEHPLGKDYKIPDNISFDFKVSLGAYFANYTFATTKGNVTADSKGDITLSVKPGEAVSIQGIDEGTQVTVTEAQSGGGFTVKGNETQTLTITKDEFAKADFVNIYTPEKVTTQNLTLKGAKNLTGRDFKPGDEFAFVLEAQSKNDTWYVLSEKTVSYSDSADFNKFDFTDDINNLTFDKVGSYAFRVSEKEGTLPGIDYDKTVNYFYVNVTDIDMDGKLEIGGIDTEQNAAVSGKFDITIDFNNGYTLPRDTSVKITANKTVKNTGTNSIGPENFTFELKGDTKNLTAKSDKNGKVNFYLDFGYEDIGKTFEYTISELSDNREGVTYSSAVYKLSVTISLGDKNELITDVKVGGKVYSDKAIVFKNTYNGKTSPETGERMPYTVHLAVIMLAGVLLTVYTICRMKKRKI